MHNIDRTNLESNYGEYTGEYPGEYYGEAGEYAGEYMGEGEYTGEYTGEGESDEFTGEYGQELETYGEYSQESPFNESEEMELAAELLTVQSEDELEQFLGKLFKKAGGFLKSGVGRQLTGALKGNCEESAAGARRRRWKLHACPVLVVRWEASWRPPQAACLDWSLKV